MIALALLALLLGACGSRPEQLETAGAAATADVPPPSTPTRAPSTSLDSNRYYPSNRRFSFVNTGLDDLKEKDTGLEYRSLVSTDPNKLMFFYVHKAFEKIDLESYVPYHKDDVEKRNQNPKTIQENFLTTEEGQAYYRWEYSVSINGQAAHVVDYLFIFEDSSLLITSLRADNIDDAAKYDSLVDTAMNTVLFNPNP
jgi:hypothetical protein